MQFLTFEFAAFVMVVLGVYYLWPKWQAFTIIVSSLFFYLFRNPSTNLIFLFWTLFIFFIKDFFWPKRLGKVIVILLAIVPLLISKYTHIGFTPMGISFITFMMISYLLNISSKPRLTLKSIRDFLNYLFFFPHIVSGPIDKPIELIKQMISKVRLQIRNIESGLWLILTGVFLKTVVGNNLGKYVEVVYGNYQVYVGWPLLLAVVFFSFQLYSDFWGYTRIARGIAKLLGIEIAINFCRPYLSKSVTEFWGRWHISLSTWLRENIYFPLGGSRNRHAIRTYTNILVVFIVSGLWHGNTWTFLLWGAMHGFVVVLERLGDKFKRSGISFTPLGILSTYVFVSLSWVLFSFNELTEAINVYISLFNLRLYSSISLISLESNKELQYSLLTGSILIFILTVYEIMTEYSLIHYRLLKPIALYRSIPVVIIILSILFFGIFAEQSFYYAKF